MTQIAQFKYTLPIVPPPEPVRTPTCPSCHTKFPHDKAHPDTCKVCGLPDYIARQGARNIARWRNKHVHQLPTNQRPAGKTQPRRRNKHGRKGVKR